MDKVLELKIPIAPMAVQSVRSRVVGKHIMHYQPAKVREWKEQIIRCVKEQLPEDWEVLTQPLEVHFVMKFPPLKSMPKRLLKQMDEGVRVYKITKPDNDNCEKGVSDCMNKLVWEDDAIVVRTFIEKYYDNDYGMEIYVYRLAVQTW